MMDIDDDVMHSLLTSAVHACAGWSSMGAMPSMGWEIPTSSLARSSRNAARSMAEYYTIMLSLPAQVCAHCAAHTVEGSGSTALCGYNTHSTLSDFCVFLCKKQWHAGTSMEDRLRMSARVCARREDILRMSARMSARRVDILRMSARRGGAFYGCPSTDIRTEGWTSYAYPTYT